jgi:hypothetical protein
MTIYQIYSLGQIVQSDIKKSLAAFSKVLQEDKYYSPAYANAVVYITFALDKFWYGTIDSFKAGRITSEIFTSKLANQLGIKNEYKIIDSWNAMCEIDITRRKELVDLFCIPSKDEVELIIVSVTNPLQYEYIVKNVNSLLEDNGLSRLENNPSINTRTSFIKENLSMVSLTKEIIELKQMDNKDNKICSGHRELTQETLDIKYARFVQDDCLSMVGKDSEL